jgi:hypothetical protein
MKIKRKGLITVAVALLIVAVIVPVYALEDPSGTLLHLRTQDPDYEHQGPATRAYGEDQPVQAQEEKSEALSEEETLEEVETPIQEQTQTQEQLRDGDCENADCEENQNQYQYQFQFQEQFRHGQGED